MSNSLVAVHPELIVEWSDMAMLIIASLSAAARKPVPPVRRCSPPPKAETTDKKLPPWLTALGEVFYQNRGSSGSGGNSQYCVRSATTAERNTGCPALKSTVSRVG